MNSRYNMDGHSIHFGTDDALTGGVSDQRFNGWEPETLEHFRQRAALKGDILDALNDGDADKATDAIIRARNYLLGLTPENVTADTAGTDNYGPAYWRNIQIPSIISGNTQGDSRVVYLDSVNRLAFTKKNDGFSVSLIGPPSPAVERQWSLVEQAYETINRTE